MALIFCPECGKKISDTVERCIHCGCELKKIKDMVNIVRTNRYEVLSISEQDKLINEFLAHYPEYKNYLDYTTADKKYLNRYIILSLIGLLFLILPGLIMYACTPLKIRKIKKRHIQAQKTFKIWLFTKKQIEYKFETSGLTEKYKQYYKNFTPSLK